MSMKPSMLVALGLFGSLIAGCSHTLPPHQEVNQALQKTLGATGYNYSSKSRITNLVVPVKEIKAAASKQDYLEKGIEIARGISVAADGAIDLKTRKSEVLYNLLYNQDNLDVSVKVPLLLDYTTQTLYVGTTFLNSIFPLPPGSKGKMIKVDFNEVFKESQGKTDRFKDVFGKKNFDSMQEGLKKGVLKGFADLKDERFADQPLTGDDKNAGVVRRVSMHLNHEESVTLFLTIADALIQRLYQDAVLSKEEYGTFMILTDRQKMDTYLAKFSMSVVLDIGLDAAGRISRMETRMAATDKDKQFQLGIENVSSFNRYDTPVFSMKPELTGTVDYKEILNAYLAAKAAAKAEAAAAKNKLPKQDEPKEEKKVTE